MRTLAEIEQEHKQVMAEIKRLSKLSELLGVRREQLRREWAITKYGLTPGVVLLYRGREYLFDHICLMWDFNKPWVKGRMRLKDGTWGRGMRSLYNDWKVKK